MARNRFVLSCALRHVFFNDFGLDRVFIMNDLAALFLYYADKDTDAALSADFNKLNTWLTKVELIRKPRKDEPAYPPKDFSFRLETSEENQTLAPVIKLPQIADSSIDEDMLDSLAEELAGIDVAAIAAFVRDKALKAGDLALVTHEDDNTEW